MKNKQINKIPKGIVSFIVIIALLSSILAASVYYENSITGNVVKETAINNQEFNLQIIYIDSIKELSQLNEGWYQIRNGYVFYLDSFSSYIPIWIKIQNPEEQNGLLVVDADGTIKFDRTFTGLPESEAGDEEENKQLTPNQITGDVTGMEMVSGFNTVSMTTNNGKNNLYCKEKSKDCQPNRNNDFPKELPPKNSWVCKGDACRVVNNADSGGTGTAGTKGSELTAFTKNGALITVVPEDNNIKITRESTSGDPTTKLIDKNLLEKVDWTNYGKTYEDTFTKYPINGGVREIISNSRFKDLYPNNVQPTREVTTTLNQDKSVMVSTISNVNTPNPTRVDVLTLEDKTKITTNFKKVNDQYDIEKVTYTTKEGKILELTGAEFKNAESKLGVNADNVLKIAAQEGFTKPRVEEGGALVEGTKKIQLIDKNIFVLDVPTNIVKKQVGLNGIITEYEGIVKLVDNKPVLEEGASAVVKERNDKGELVVTQIQQKIKGELVTGNYKNTNSIEIVILGATYTISKEPVQDGQFKGMFSLNGRDCSNCYIDAVSGFGLPFGLGGAKILDQNGKEVVLTPDLSAVISNLNKERESKGTSTFEQASSQRFFAQVERVFTEFRGLGYYATLFFDEYSLLTWRDSVDRIFATLYLGTEYWSSGLCSQYIDGEDNGIAYAETPQGLAQVGAHVEATRTKPISGLDGTEFIYKITFNVRNGDFKKDPRAPEEMSINIVLKGQNTARVFRNNIKIERGDTFGRVGSSAIVQDSNFLYSKVCITFDKVPFKWSIDGNELCNKIIEGSGEAIPISAKTSGTGGGGSSPGNDINDF
ncbi:hypothetical protein HYW20_07260 [Candidatus Woesearchaeota archaeon]|nr:hypothetical protein [Candidatus Woesearchaeota archaeon]